MKATDYIVREFVKRGVEVVFGYPGGMVTHLTDSLYKFSKDGLITTKICCHEQGAGFAACGYAAASGKVGVAFATSGPGATNLITAICHAYFESVPVVFITGQVNTYESRGELGLSVRQKGFQETDIIEMVKGVTKYAEYIDNVSKLPDGLNKAFTIASNGRPGAVLLDIPMNVQRGEIQERQTRAKPEGRALLIRRANLDVGKSEIKPSNNSTGEFLIKNDDFSAFDIIKKELKRSKRPVILAGNGINSTNMRCFFKRFAENIKLPFISSMLAVDLFDEDFSEYYGFIGAYGSRTANMIVSQCDLLISLGSRLDSRQTGAMLAEFAPNARLIRVDIDDNELAYRIKPDEIQIRADLRELLPKLSETDFPHEYSDRPMWKAQCERYKEQLSAIDNYYVNRLIEDISGFIPDNVLLTADVGQNQVWLAQSFKFKKGQRMFFSGGHGAMGFSLPAAIGGCYAGNTQGKKAVFSFSGDGGMQMNIQELQTIKRENLPVKIFVLNNGSLGMIRCFQEIYFDSVFSYTNASGGYTAPDFVKLAEAYGIPAHRITSADELALYTDELNGESPVLFDIVLGASTYVTPKLAYNKPIYDQDPPIDRELLKRLLGEAK